MNVLRDMEMSFYKILQNEIILWLSYKMRNCCLKTKTLPEIFPRDQHSNIAEETSDAHKRIENISNS